MGWNSWYGVGCKVNDADVRAHADIMLRNGMRDLGYTYVNIDGCWEGNRDAQGVIHPNAKFPDMKALADYVHSKGFKFGVYSSPGPKTCDQLEGSYGHETQDAQTFADWGVDFLKYDWCSATEVYKFEDAPAVARKMHDALLRTGRPILFSLCIGLVRPWTWGPSAGGSMWRTAEDLEAKYERITLIGFEQNGLERFAGPGHWNDPDCLYVGLGDLDANENRTHMSLWCLLAAPLLTTADLRKISAESLAILTNPEVIAVDQDRAGIQGHRISEEGPLDVWMKPLADGSKALGLFNRGDTTLPVTLVFKDAGLPRTARLRDLWAQKDLGTFVESFTAAVPKHGVVMVKAH
jgi:alpha-galactosidase